MPYPLPQELTNKILSQLPDNSRQFQNYSLVAPSWVYPSQKRLLKSVQCPLGEFQSLLRNIPGEKLKFIHQLTCEGERFFEPLSYHPGELNALRDLSQLRHLKCIWTYFLPSSQNVVFFSAFQDTLSAITLSHCDVSISGLATVINYFKNLKSLYLESLLIQHSEQTALSLRTLEKLSIGTGSPGLPYVLSNLSRMGLRFDEVAFKCASYTDSTRALSIFGASVRRVRLLNTWAKGMCDPLCSYCVWTPGHNTLTGLTLLSCLRLSELEFWMMQHPSYKEELELVLSIESKNIEKIIIMCSGEYLLPQVKNDFWEKFGNTLTELFKKLGLGNKLELELRGEWNDVLGNGANRIWESHLDIYRVTVWDVQNNLIYSSD